MARRPYRSFNRKSARETVWVASAAETDATALAAGAAVLDSVSGSALLELRPFTIVRTRGVICMGTDQLTGTENPYVGLAFAVVSEAAATAGVAAVPTPFTEEDSDFFFVYETVHQRFILSSAIGLDPQGFVSKYFDSKAMRKVNNDSTIITVLENGNSTAGLVYQLKYRILIKLH